MENAPQPDDLPTVAALAERLNMDMSWAFCNCHRTLYVLWPGGWDQPRRTEYVQELGWKVEGRPVLCPDCKIKARIMTAIKADTTLPQKGDTP